MCATTPQKPKRNCLQPSMEAPSWIRHGPYCTCEDEDLWRLVCSGSQSNAVSTVVSCVDSVSLYFDWFGDGCVTSLLISVDLRQHLCIKKLFNRFDVVYCRLKLHLLSTAHLCSFIFLRLLMLIPWSERWAETNWTEVWSDTESTPTSYYWGDSWSVAPFTPDLLVQRSRSSRAEVNAHLLQTWRF